MRVINVHLIEGNKCTLNVYQTSTSGEEIKSQSHEIEASPIPGHFYLVEYERSLFPEKVVAVTGNGTIRVICLQKSHMPKGSTWKWPEIEDVYDYPLGDSKHEIDIPKLLPDGSRSIVFEVPQLSHMWRN